MDWGLLAARIAGAIGVVVAAIFAVFLFLTTTFGPAEPNDPLYRQLATLVRTATVNPPNDWADVSDKVCPMVDAAKLDQLMTATDALTRARDGRSYRLEVSLWPVQNCYFSGSRRRGLDITPVGPKGQCQAVVALEHACGP
jgi:hypothetical protein